MVGVTHQSASVANTLLAKLKRFIRAFSLLWGRMGSARIYVAVVAGAVMALAGLGVWHLYSSGKQTEQSTGKRTALNAGQPATSLKTHETASIAGTPTFTKKSDNAITTASPGDQISSQTLTVPSAPPQVAGDVQRVVAITDVRQTKRSGRHGETFVVATIGMAPRSKVEKSDLEIHVFFYDLSANNEMRPTDAQVTYQWLTPVRDWNDPTPKYLAATYLKPRMPRRPSEKLRYGGFVVRVYVGGKLQDERSEPEGLLSASGSGGQQSQNSNTAAVVSASPGLVTSPVIEKKSTANTGTALPIASPSPTIESGSKDRTQPYGKPISGKPGFLSSPFDPKFVIDVRGFPPGTLVKDPNTGKVFRVP